MEHSQKAKSNLKNHSETIVKIHQQTNHLEKPNPNSFFNFRYLFLFGYFEEPLTLTQTIFENQRRNEFKYIFSSEFGLILGKENRDLKISWICNNTFPSKQLIQYFTCDRSFSYCFSEKLNQWWKLFTNENDHAKMLELDWMEILKSSIKHTFNEITFSIREGTWNEQSIHLWNWILKSHDENNVCWMPNNISKSKFKWLEEKFLNNFGHHYEFQMKKTPKKLHSLSIFANGNRIHNYKREIMKDEWRWFNLLWKTKFFDSFSFGTFCCQFENSFLFELCFFFQPATFNSKWITIQND